MSSECEDSAHVEEASRLSRGAGWLADFAENLAQDAARESTPWRKVLLRWAVDAWRDSAANYEAAAIHWDAAARPRSADAARCAAALARGDALVCQ